MNVDMTGNAVQCCGLRQIASDFAAVVLTTCIATISCMRQPPSDESPVRPENNQYGEALPASVSSSEARAVMDNFFRSARESGIMDVDYRLDCIEHCYPSHMICKATPWVSCYVVVKAPAEITEVPESGTVSADLIYYIAIDSNHTVVGNVLDACRTSAGNCDMHTSAKLAAASAVQVCSIEASEISTINLEWDLMRSRIVWSIKSNAEVLALVAANDGRVLECASVGD